jgi:NAD(P)-dependent dehydrogenase (short-subunit alcohol dehydrogenase family)
MDRFLENKTAIITGGTRGIGYSIAEALLDAGASVAVCGRSQHSTDEAVKTLRMWSKSKVVGAAADVSKPDQVSTFFQMVDREFGAPDILVNNAGVGKFASVAALTIEDWTRTLETNLSGVFYCCHEALPRYQQSCGEKRFRRRRGLQCLEVRSEWI